jgi:hypothetical protein
MGRIGVEIAVSVVGPDTRESALKRDVLPLDRFKA